MKSYNILFNAWLHSLKIIILHLSKVHLKNFFSNKDVKKKTSYWYFIMWIYPNVFLHLPSNGHFVCSQFLASKNKAVMNIHIHIFVWAYAFISFKYLAME